MQNNEYIMHESEVARLERTIHRLWVLCIIIFMSFVLSNAAWIYYESQFQITEETKIEAEQDGDTNIVGGGDINYGAESKNH